MNTRNHNPTKESTVSYEFDHSQVPAVYVCVCGGCGKTLKRVLEHRAWEPYNPGDDCFAIECWSCGEQTVAYRDFLEPEIVA